MSNEQKIDDCKREAKDGGSLAFEVGFEEVNPPVLFRVCWKNAIREGGRDIDRVNWFADRKVAELHACWLNENDRGKDITITEYAIARAVSEATDP